MEVFISRADVQDKIKELVGANRDKDLVKLGVQSWLREQAASDLQISQILKDLTSYKEYLELVN